MKEAKERTRSSRPIPPRDGSKLIKAFLGQAEDLPHDLLDTNTHMLHVNHAYKNVMKMIGKKPARRLLHLFLAIKRKKTQRR
ncbi:uncharacterized protein PITG_00405 [Phytophthora infestans T30-4]|uniref:Uncharacterized protein n=1 Tax=Phytophthora infestans (strain T30-4) TaxID=403677 RepID=D0MQQ3_PHYIT|nr:uncharacterized protein PITG_00405 [Phytophthora infestans T30-4]EEY57822.1 hypothetical protein PITG_00405 [Phytophthora infestans T30-4]|eukprot:XP_002909008.1 hypothetical protein PITG_00405 [Phytophthora infestans T30-4]